MLAWGVFVWTLKFDVRYLTFTLSESEDGVRAFFLAKGTSGVERYTLGTSGGSLLPLGSPFPSIPSPSRAHVPRLVCIGRTDVK